MFYGRSWAVVLVVTVFLGLGCGSNWEGEIAQQKLAASTQPLALVNRLVASYFDWKTIVLVSNLDNQILEGSEALALGLVRFAVNKNGIFVYAGERGPEFDESMLNSVIKVQNDRIRADAVELQYAVLTEELWETLDSVLVSFHDFSSCSGGIEFFRDRSSSWQDKENKHIIMRLMYFFISMRQKNDGFEYVILSTDFAKSRSTVFRPVDEEFSLFFVRFKIKS